jgi:hypothetical protein
MCKYLFDFSDIDKLSDYFRSRLNPSSSADRIYFPPEIGEGYLLYYKISPEVFLIINNYKANTDIEYVRRPIDEKDIILHFRKYALDHQLEKDQLEKLTTAGFAPDYFCVRRVSDLLPATSNDKALVVLTAARLGKPRLIDNLRVTVTG